MNIQNYSNYINYTKRGSACENRFCLRLYVSETQTETPTASQCYYHLYTSLSQRVNNDIIHARF